MDEEASNTPGQAVAQGPADSPLAARKVAGYVDALRRRAGLLLGLRALAASAGTAAILLVFTAAFAGPVIAPGWANAAVGLLLAAAICVFAAALWPLRRLQGSRACSLLSAADPALASRLRSALELDATPVGQASQALIDAHARGLGDRLAQLPVASVLPLRRLRHPLIYLGVGAVAWSGLLLAVSPELQSGVSALIDPAQVRHDGLRVARVLRSLQARVVYPSYLGLDSKDYADPEQLVVPRGSTVELTVTPRIEARQAVVRVGQSAIRMDRLESGQLGARFVARNDAPLQIRLRSGADWYADNVDRAVRVLPDLSPEVRIEAPKDGTVVKLHDVVEVRFSASDDHGLTTLDLLVRLPNGQEERRRLWSLVSSRGEPRQLVDTTALVPSELGVNSGDVILLWLEARDADVVSGPNIGTSNAVSLEIASNAQTLSLQLPRLREALDSLLDLLADRLELPLPKAPADARRRFGILSQKTESWLQQLQDLLAESSRDSGQLLLDVDQLEGIADRTRREHRREQAAYRDAGHERRWPQLDQRMVTEHEKDVLLLSDMFAQALVDEAQVLTQELSELKDEMRALLEQLKQTDSPSTRRALLSELAKAQRRLRELATSLSRLSKRVPSEFINREAIPQDSASSAIDDLKSAIEAGDMAAAERYLENLSQHIDELAEHIDSGGARFRESRFGPRDQAMGEARKRLSMLAQEQERLAHRTDEIVKRATKRSQGQQERGLDDRGLSELSERIERDLRSIDGRSLSDFESRLLDRVNNRMRDSSDALKTGDVAEAGRMASSAMRDLEQAAASLQADARRSPEHRGTVDNAQAAAGAMQNLQELQDRIEEATPSLRDLVGPGERQQMKSDVQPQQSAQQAARELEDQMGQGPGGTPLSPGGQQTLREVGQSMERARRALDRGDPQDAAQAQEDASQRLRQLEEQLAQRGKSAAQRSGERQGEGEGGDGGTQSKAPVRIPGADEFSGPVQMRRRLLDAMREESPAGYEDAVKRYYRELLR